MPASSLPPRVLRPADRAAPPSSTARASSAAGRQDRQRPGPALGEVRDPQRRRQPLCRRGRRRVPGRRGQRHPRARKPARGRGPRRPRPRLPDLRGSRRPTACCRRPSGWCCSTASPRACTSSTACTTSSTTTPSSSPPACWPASRSPTSVGPRTRRTSSSSRAAFRRHLPADRGAGHRRRGRQAHHRDPARPGAQRPRRQGRHGRHRSDHDHPGRRVRRRPDALVPQFCSGEVETRWSPPGRARTPTSSSSRVRARSATRRTSPRRTSCAAAVPPA